MTYKTYYNSPLGEIILLSNGNSLSGLWFETASYYPEKTVQTAELKSDLSVFLKTTNWLDRYFGGQKISADDLPLCFDGTDFRKTVWNELLKIPYGKTVTYGELAKRVAKIIGKPCMSAQAIGGAVGHNPISIIVPCHRVIGADGNLVGYGSGLDKKQWLLKHEVTEHQVKK